MLLARAPLRISLAGGGTDLAAYYTKYGGAVVSLTVDKYFYVFLSLSESPHIQVTSSDYRTFYRQRLDESPLWDGDLSLPKAIIDHFGLQIGLSVFLASQVPPGTGLGSSSAVAVALIKALSVLTGRRLSRRQVAELACQIEIQKLGMPIGKQDQYAASFGGLNYFEFHPHEVNVRPIELPLSSLLQLEDRLMLFYTGRSRNSGQILSEQKRNSEDNRSSVIEALHVIKQAAVDLAQELARGNIASVGHCLDESWKAKRLLAHGISDPWIDQWYEAAKAAGASGGKIAGAGGGGFLLVYCEPEHQDCVTSVLRANGLTPLGFRLESAGAIVLTNTLAGRAGIALGYAGG
jgi:D-glycero-alpha-D-manno-heptose-7-phosphate kinase